MSKRNRQDQRHPVSWPTRLRVGQDFLLVGRAVDASRHGVCVSLLTWVPSGILQIGQGCGVEVDTEKFGVCRRRAEIRNVSRSSVGLRIRESLPAGLLGQASHGASLTLGSLGDPVGIDASHPGSAVDAFARAAAVVTSAIRGMSDVARTSIGEALEISALAAVRHAVLRDLNAAKGLLDEVSRLVRAAERLDALASDEVAAIESAVAIARGSAPLKATPSILVVDDEANVRALLRDYLAAEGYIVSEAQDGAEALERARRDRPDLVLLDTGLPGMDGLEVLKQLRLYDPSIAVIMITGNQDIALARATVNLGAVDYMFKPLDFDRLDRAILAGIEARAS